MNAPRTLGDALRAAAAAAPAAPALVGDAGTLSWGELAQRVERVAAGLRRGLAAGAPPHAVMLRPERDDLIVLLAHALAGIALLPLHPALPEAEAARLAAAAQLSVRP